MLSILDNILNDETKKAWIEADPIRHATFMAVREYVKQGNKLSAIPWFASLNFEVIEGREEAALKKAA